MRSGVICPRARARAGRPGQTSHPGAPSHRRTRGAGHTHATPPPSHGPATHKISGGKRPACQSTQAGNHSHTQRPPSRTLAAVRSPGTARHASRATAPSTRTAKEARHWAIGGRHGENRARMCGLQHLPHDPQIPDQRFTGPTSQRFSSSLGFVGPPTKPNSASDGGRFRWGLDPQSLVIKWW